MGWWVTGSVVTVVVGVVVLVVSVAAGNSGRHTRVPVSARAAAPMLVADVHAADGCRQSGAGLAVSGTGPGDTRSGPGAILAFNRAYYVDRSSARVVEVLAPGAEAVNTERGERYPLTADGVESGIRKVPANTRYCVRVEPDAPDRWRVTVTEQVGDQITAVAQQRIATTRVGGRTLIETIVAP